MWAAEKKPHLNQAGLQKSRKGWLNQLNIILVRLSNLCQAGRADHFKPAKTRKQPYAFLSHFLAAEKIQIIFFFLDTLLHHSTKWDFGKTWGEKNPIGDFFVPSIINLKFCTKENATYTLWILQQKSINSFNNTNNMSTGKCEACLHGLHLNQNNPSILSVGNKGASHLKSHPHTSFMLFFLSIPHYFVI